MTDVVEKPSQPRNQRAETRRPIRPVLPPAQTLRAPGTSRHAAIEIPATIGIVGSDERPPPTLPTPPHPKPAWNGRVGNFPTVQQPAVEAVEAPTGALYRSTGRKRPERYQGTRRALEPLWVRLAVLIGSGMLGGALVVVAALALLWAVAR